MQKSDSASAARPGKRLKLMTGRILWPFMGILALTSLVLGYVGFALYFAGRGESAGVSDILYLALQLFTLESGAVEGSAPWPLDVARWLAPVVAGLTAFKALAVIFRKQFDDLRIGRLRRHVVICGLGRKGFKLAQSFRRQGDKVVVLEFDAENDAIEAVRAEGVLVRTGDARDPEFLRQVGVGKALNLIAVCGDDGANAEIAIHARELVGKRRGRVLSCQVQIADPHLCRLLQLKEIERSGKESIRIEYFNLYDVGAYLLLDEYLGIGDPDRELSPENHLVIAGLGKFGESVVRQAAWALRSSRKSAPGKRLAVTVLDRNAVAKSKALAVRETMIGRYCDFKAKDLEFESPEFQKADFLLEENGGDDISSIYVCTDDDSMSLRVGLAFQRKLKARDIPIVVRMVHDSGLATLLAPEAEGEQHDDNLQAFGLLDRVCTPELMSSGSYERIARALHEYYLRRQLAAGDRMGSTPAMAQWHEMPEYVREANRDHAAHVGIKLHLVGCELLPVVDDGAPLFQFEDDEIKYLARLEHQRWVDEKRRTGWKETKGKRDDEGKRHPDIVPWAELSEEKKDVDRDFIRDLPEILSRVGYGIARAKRLAPSSSDVAPQTRFE